MRLAGLAVACMAVTRWVGAAPAEATNSIYFRFPHEGFFRAADQEVKEGNATWVRAWPEDGSTNWVEFGERVVLELERPGDLARVTAGSGLTLSRQVTETIFILDAGSARNAVRQAQRLAGLPGVAASYPVLRREGGLHGAYFRMPADNGFGLQEWWLENRLTNGTRAGADLNVRAAWPWTLGQGVTVSVDDVGVELRHEELSNNAAGAPHHNFSTGTTNGNPVNRGPNGAHGTEVAGLLGAGLDNFRMAGVAPKARLASCVIFTSNLVTVADDKLMDAYQYESNVIAVQNHSWGESYTYGGLLAPTALEQVGISNAITKGRGGLGTIFVRSCGDGRGIGQDANDSLYASDPRVIGVGGVINSGRVASYSDTGASVLVAAPGGDPNNPLFTTDLLGTDGVNQLNFFPPNQDLNDYVFSSLGFVGTSASAPLVTGVAALMLSVNTNLTWRDAQHILLLSARHFDWATRMW